MGKARERTVKEIQRYCSTCTNYRAAKNRSSKIAIFEMQKASFCARRFFAMQEKSECAEPHSNLARFLPVVHNQSCWLI